MSTSIVHFTKKKSDRKDEPVTLSYTAFEGENEKRVAVDNDRSFSLIRTKFFVALRRKREVNMHTVIFQQDGAPFYCMETCMHTISLHLEFLRPSPLTILISRRIDFLWPPYPFTSTLLDYFLWGYLEERIYGKSATIPDSDSFEGQLKKGYKAHNN